MNKRIYLSVLPMVLVLAITGCSKDGGDGKSTQAVARVNGEELTVHQINLELSGQQIPANADQKEISQRALEGVINRQLLVQKAKEAKLDRDPMVMQAIERAKQQVLAQSYIQKVVATLPTPSDSEIQQYFDKSPELFAKRKIYQLQEFIIDSKISEDELSKQVAAGKTIQSFTTWLTKEKIQAKVQSVIKPAEQIPLTVLPAMAMLKNGQGTVIVTPNGNSVVWMLAFKEQPLTLEQAKPIITRYLGTQKQKEKMASEIKSLRDAAKVEYLGMFAEQSKAMPEKETLQQGMPEAKPAGENADAPATGFIDKGVSGLK